MGWCISQVGHRDPVENVQPIKSSDGPRSTSLLPMCPQAMIFRQFTRSRAHSQISSLFHFPNKLTPTSPNSTSGENPNFIDFDPYKSPENDEQQSEEAGNIQFQPRLDRLVGESLPATRNPLPRFFCSVSGWVLPCDFGMIRSNSSELIFGLTVELIGAVLE